MVLGYVVVRAQLNGITVGQELDAKGRNTFLVFTNCLKIASFCDIQLDHKKTHKIVIFLFVFEVLFII